jgi:long-subunit acyl-CoA synthetase (AMP-forming)
VTIPELLPKVIDAQKLMANEPKKKPIFVVSINLGGSKPDGTWDFNEMLDPSIDTSILKRSGSNEDMVFLPYSSGTTGLSKGVCLSHKNIMANIAQVDHPEITHLFETTGKKYSIT